MIKKNLLVSALLILSMTAYGQVVEKVYNYSRWDGKGLLDRGKERTTQSNYKPENGKRVREVRQREKLYLFNIVKTTDGVVQQEITTADGTVLAIVSLANFSITKPDGSKYFRIQKDNDHWGYALNGQEMIAGEYRKAGSLKQIVITPANKEAEEDEVLQIICLERGTDILDQRAVIARNMTVGIGKGSEPLKTQFGFKSGINVSKFTASINSTASSKVGFHVGAFVKAPINDNLFIRPEFFYSSQGQKDDFASAGSTTTTVNYFNIPVLLEAGKKVTFQIGPQLGFLLSAHEKGKIAGTNVNDDLKDLMKPTDISLLLGLSANPGKHVHIGVRYQLGFTEIFEKPKGFTGSFPTISNRVLHFYVAFPF